MLSAPHFDRSGRSDIGAVLGLGFSPLTGGPFRFVDHIGPAQLAKDKERFAAVYGVGFEPYQPVHDQAASGTKFCSAGWATGRASCNADV